MSTVIPNALPVPAPEQTDRQFRVFADSIQNLAWIAQADGFIYWFNQSWYTYTGTTPRQMEGWGWKDVHDPSVLPDVLIKWTASIATGEPFDMVFPIKRADGVFRPFLTRAVPYKDESGRVLNWFGTNTEISKEVDTANALRLSEARFRTATEAVNAILWTNNAAGEMSGPQPGWTAFTGQTLPEYQGFGWGTAVHPEDIQPTLEGWEKSVRNRTLFSSEHRVRRHDGIYRLCSIRALPILDDSGAVLEWVGVHTDITEERENQIELSNTVAALREQQELIEVAEMVSQIGYWRLRPSVPELFLSAGSRHLLDLPLTGEITLHQALAAVHPLDRKAVETALQDALRTGHYRVEFRTNAAAPQPVAPSQTPGAPPREDLSPRWIRGVAKLFVSSTGAPYLVGKNIDISHEKRSAEALIRTEKLAVAGRLAASIAHEINNPLEAITNLAYLLAQTNLDAEQNELMESLQSELNRVSHIATHTLRFHRQSTRGSLIEVASLTDSVLALFEGRIRNYSVQVHTRLRAKKMISGFDGDLRQVIANLVGNAIDAMQSVPEPRVLSLRSSDARHPVTGRPGIRITVADSGTGISSAHAARIFEPFFTTKPDTGTGLGLWVSHEIVAKHSGSMRLRSSTNPPSRGTVFHIFLPTI